MPAARDVPNSVEHIAVRKEEAMVTRGVLLKRNLWRP
jgi:hypothetical protein